MSRFVDGILVGLGIGLILIAGTMYFLMAGAAAELKAQENETTSQWVIVVKHSDTTVTETATVPSLEQYRGCSALPSNLMSMFQFVGFFGALLFLAGVVPPFASKGKTPAPSND
jgi:hypothetical protein